MGFSVRSYLTIVLGLILFGQLLLVSTMVQWGEPGDNPATAPAENSGREGRVLSALPDKEDSHFSIPNAFRDAPKNRYHDISKLTPVKDPLRDVPMVVMYVNGSDPAVAKPRAKAGGPVVSSSRDRDNGEFRFLLRSLDKFAPWYEGSIVVLLHDNETPARWLNTSHPRIRIVRHSEYFVDQSHTLPTFSSDAIHANMHHIPGIGNRLINWCDDFFLGRPVEPEDWFVGETPVVYFEPHHIGGGMTGFKDLQKSRGNKWRAKIYHTKGMVEQKFPRKINTIRANFVKHAPFPMDKRVLVDAANTWQAEYTRSMSFKFRDYDTIDVPTIHNLYCQVKDKCIVPSQKVTDDAARLLVLKKDDEENMKKLLDTFAAVPPKFFTFNDGWGNGRPRTVEFAFEEFLPTLFPLPSQFELPGVL